MAKKIRSKQAAPKRAVAKKKPVAKAKAPKQPAPDTTRRNTLGEKLFEGPNGKWETARQRAKRLRRNARVSKRRKAKRAAARALREAAVQHVPAVETVTRAIEEATPDLPLEPAAGRSLGELGYSLTGDLGASGGTRTPVPRKDIVIGPEEVTTYVDGQKRGTHFDVVTGTRWAQAQAAIAAATGAFTVAIHDLRS